MTRSNVPVRLGQRAPRVLLQRTCTRSRDARWRAAHSAPTSMRQRALVDRHHLARPAPRRRQIAKAPTNEYASSTRRPCASCSTRARRRPLVEVEARLLPELERDAERAGRARPSRASARRSPRTTPEAGSNFSIFAVAALVRSTIARGDEHAPRAPRAPAPRAASCRWCRAGRRATSPNRSTMSPGSPSPSACTSRKPVVCVARQPQRRPQRHSPLQPRVEEGGVEPRLLVANQQAHRDRRSRRVEAAPEQVAARIDDAHLVTGRRTSLHALDGLRIHPGVPHPHGLHVPWLEADDRHGARHPRARRAPRRASRAAPRVPGRGVNGRRRRPALPYGGPRTAR